MKSLKEIMQGEKITAPNFDQPKGLAFEKAMFKIFSQVGIQTEKKNKSLKQINEIKDAINQAHTGMLMAEDEFEEMTFRKRKQELQKELENVDDYSDLNVQAYKKKLISNPAIQQLEAEAKAEYFEILNAAEEYKREMAKVMKEIEQFKTTSKSSSHYRAGYRIFNS